MIAAPISPREKEADEWAERMQAERLTHIRELGEKWSTTVGSLTSLLGAASIVTGDTSVRSLLWPWGLIYGVLAAVALVAAAGSILWAAAAAQGKVKKNPKDVAGLIQLRDQLFEEAERDLARSRWAAGVAVLFLLVSFAVRWYAPAITAT